MCVCVESSRTREPRVCARASSRTLESARGCGRGRERERDRGEGEQAEGGESESTTPKVRERKRERKSVREGALGMY